MNATADTTQVNRTSLFNSPGIKFHEPEDPISIDSLDGIEAELAKLYRSLRAHQGGLSVEQSSRRRSVEGTIDDLIAWMANERGLSFNYQISTRRSLEGFATWIKNKRGAAECKSLNAIRTGELTAYLASEKQRGLASASLKLITIALKIFFRFLTSHGDLKQDPAKMLHAPRVSSRLPQILNKEEINKLLSADLNGRPYPLRDRAMLELFYSSGLRLSELTRAKLENLSLSERMIRVTGKGNKTRLIPVNHTACRAIEDYLNSERIKLAGKTCAPEIFLSRRGRAMSNQMAWLIVKEIALAAGIKRRVYPHLFRHTMASDLLIGGANLRVIQELLGHENISTTETYLHLDSTYLREIIRRHHPRGVIHAPVEGNKPSREPLL